MKGKKKVCCDWWFVLPVCCIRTGCHQWRYH